MRGKWEPGSVCAIFSGVDSARVAATFFANRQSIFLHCIHMLSVRSLGIHMLSVRSLGRFPGMCHLRHFLIHTLSPLHPCLSCEGLVHTYAWHYIAAIPGQTTYGASRSICCSRLMKAVSPALWMKTVCTVCTTGHIIWNLQQRVGETRTLIGVKGPASS